MATKIILKKSSTAGGTPLVGALDQAELAINLADRKIYTKDNSGAIVSINGAYVDSVAPSVPAEGDLWYDTTNNALKAYNGSAWANTGFSTIAALEDVTISAVASGEVLKWNGTAWVNNTLAEAGIAPTSHSHAAADITSGTLADARVAQSNVTQHQAALSITESQISDLQAYLTSITGESVADLSDVTITTVASGEVLKWNGTAWVNNTLAEAGIAAASHTHAASDVTSGTFANARISQSSVTQHQAALTITESQISDLQAYLTAETDTLATVTGRGSTTASAITVTNATSSTTSGTGALVVTGGVGIGENLNVNGNTVIGGDLTVNGTTTSVNSNEVNIGDAVVLLNADETGVPSQNAGFEVERGTSTNVSFIWDETADAWTLGDNTLQGVVIDGGSY